MDERLAKNAYASQGQRLSRSLSSVVADLDPNAPMPVTDGPELPNPTALAPRINMLEMSVQELNAGTARGFEHISERMRRIEKALGL